MSATTNHEDCNNGCISKNGNTDNYDGSDDSRNEENNNDDNNDNDNDDIKDNNNDDSDNNDDNNDDDNDDISCSPTFSFFFILQLRLLFFLKN